MKKQVISLIVVFIVFSSFPTNMAFEEAKATLDYERQVRALLDNPNDSIWLFNFSIPYTGIMSIVDLKGVKVPISESNMHWAINKRTGKGTCLDLFPDMVTVYSLKNVVFTISKTSNGKTFLLVTGLMETNEGAIYSFTINDEYNSISVQGPEIAGIIVKRYNSIGSKVKMASEITIGR